MNCIKDLCSESKDIDKYYNGMQTEIIWRLIYAKNSRLANNVYFSCKHVFFLIQPCKYVNPNCRMLKSTFLNVGLFYCNLYICNASNVNLH